MKIIRLLIGLVVISIFIFVLADRKELAIIEHKTEFSPPKKVKMIVVKRGECLSTIAHQRGISWKYLARLNDMEENPSFVREGQTLKVPAE